MSNSNIFNKELVDLYYRPPVEGEVNLVDIIYYFLSECGDGVAASLFLQHNDVQNVAKLNSATQRVVINSVLLNVLLAFRHICDINVNVVLPILANDGDTADWIELVKEMIVPFLLENKVLETVTDYTINMYNTQQG